MKDKLIVGAAQVRQHARAPYSNFRVGAALESTDGRVYTGCNIENASLGLTVCAERVALWKALSEGAASFHAIAVVTDSPAVSTPCGSCRQLLWEYCGDLRVYLHSTQGLDAEFQLSELLPHPFDHRNLK
jgi:cytidine deaminase